MTNATHRFTNFAYHVSCMMEETGTLRFGLPDGSVVEIVVTPNGKGHPPIWDQTTVNGKNTGNRCGGRDAFAKLFEAALLDLSAGALRGVEAHGETGAEIRTAG